jgi:hypothetical protein
MPSVDKRIAAIVVGLGAGFLTFVGVEVAAGILSVVVNLFDRYTGLIHLGPEWSNWLGVVFLYWGVLPAAFLALVVFARVCKSRWNGKPAR